MRIRDKFMKDNILNDFKTYLASKSAVNEKYAPYYVKKKPRDASHIIIPWNM